MIVIAVGSPMAGDDLAWDVAQCLANTSWASDWDIHMLDRPGPGLVTYLDTDQPVIILDTLKADMDENAVWIEPDDLLEQGNGWSTHDLGVAEALVLAEALGVDMEQVRVMGIVSGTEAALNLLRPQ